MATTKKNTNKEIKKEVKEVNTFKAVAQAYRTKSGNLRFVLDGKVYIIKKNTIDDLAYRRYGECTILELVTETKEETETTNVL